MSNIIKLVGPEILASIVDTNREGIDSTDRPFRTLAYEGIGFTVSPNIAKQILDGDLAQLNLLKGKRVLTKQNKESGEYAPVLDDEGKEQMIDSYQYVGSVTWKAMRNVRTNESELNHLDDIVKARMLKEAGISLSDFFSKDEEKATTTTAPDGSAEQARAAAQA